MSNQEVDFKIVDLILSTGVLPKESRLQPTFHECIHELSSLPISRLSTEPAYLRECHKRVVEENYKWAYDNYSTFIQTAECTKEIFTDFENVQTMNEKLAENIPNFLQSGQRFIDQCRQNMNLANMNSLTLQKHNQILEILEIPQLLEACIRNNYLDEALELIAHSRKLERRHPNIGIITNVTQEVRVAAQKLLDQLFQQLGANLQLPSCLKIVGYLRRMDCVPETLLRLKFLQCRDNYLMGLLRSLASTDPFFHATKYMEVTRVNLFDIATQYRAVFNDDDLYSSSTDSLGQQHHMLFSSWLVMRVDVFISSLSVDINSIVDSSVSYSSSSAGNAQSSSQSVGSKLQSLLGQSMYFGLSLSRIGSDFRGLLIPVFYQAIMKYVDMRLLEMSDSFSEWIGSYKWTVTMDQCEDMSNLSVSLSLAHQVLTNPRSEELVAPVKLMNHPLLALVTNQMVSILEDIRLCCPRLLRHRICQSFSDTIHDLLKSLMKYYQEEGGNFTSKEQQSFVAMISALLCCFLPHIDLCLTVLFSTDVDVSPRIGSSIDIGSLSELFSDILPSSFYTVPHEDNDDGGLNEEEIGQCGEEDNVGRNEEKDNNGKNKEDNNGKNEEDNFGRNEDENNNGKNKEDTVGRNEEEDNNGKNTEEDNVGKNKEVNVCRNMKKEDDNDDMRKAEDNVVMNEENRFEDENKLKGHTDDNISMNEAEICLKVNKVDGNKEEVFGEEEMILGKNDGEIWKDGNSLCGHDDVYCEEVDNVVMNEGVDDGVGNGEGICEKVDISGQLSTTETGMEDLVRGEFLISGGDGSADRGQVSVSDNMGDVSMYGCVSGGDRDASENVR